MLSKKLVQGLALIFAVSMLLTVCSCGDKGETAESSSKAAASQDAEESQATESIGSAVSEESSVSSEVSSAAVSSGKGTSSKASSQATASIPNSTTKQSKMVDPGALVGTGVMTDPKLTESVVDLKGKTYTLGTFWANDWKTDSGTMAAVANMKAISTIEKDYNCNINMRFIDANLYLQEAATFKASGKVYCHLYDSELEFNDLIKNGHFAKLDNIKSVGLKTNEWNKALTLGGTYKNYVYGVGVKQENINRNCMFFNMTMAKKLNLEDIYQLVKDKKWTIEKYEELSKKAYDPSKKIYGTVSTFQPYMLTFIYTNKSSPVMLKDGIPVFNGLDDAVLDMINFADDYSAAGYYDKLHSKGHAISLNQFVNGKALFYIADWWIRQDLSVLMNDKYGIVPLPMGPRATNYTSLITNTRYFSVTSSTNEQENLGKLLVALANRSYIKKAEWDKKVTPTICDAESLDMLHRIMSGDATFYQSLSSFETEAMKCIVDQSVTAKQAMQSVQQKAQTEINKIYG